MFNKFSFCAVILALSASFGFAQTTTGSDYHKFEVFGGYSNNQVDTGASNDDNDLGDFFDDRESLNGFEISGVGNVNRYVGIKGDFSGHYKNYEFDVPTFGTVTTTDQFKVKTSLYNFLGGVQVKDNRKEGSRFRPFAHALAGVAHARAKVDGSFLSSPFCGQLGVDCLAGFDESTTGFAAAIGGGIDIKATDKISIRAVQFDYNPNRIGGSTQNNFRFGVGVVFH